MRISILFFILILSVAVDGQDKSNDTTARYFLIQASIGNLQEIALGKLAQVRATSPAVKAFARQMVADHNQIQAELVQLVRSSASQIPHEATDPPVEDLMLKNAPTGDFDKLYVHMMVPDHGQTVQLYEKYALIGKDPAVKAFAALTLPLLKKHLVTITAIDKTMNDEAASK
jgi:putative membrane protein